MWQNVRKRVGLAHLLLQAPCNIHYEIFFFLPKLQFGNMIKKNLDLQREKKAHLALCLHPSMRNTYCAHTASG